MNQLHSLLKVAYFIDLELFLGNPVSLVPKRSKASSDSVWHNVLGSVGQNLYDEYSDIVNGWHERSQVSKRPQDAQLLGQ